MATADPGTCPVCKRARVWIGIAGAAEPACPKDCSECYLCNKPGAQLKLVSASTADYPEPGPPMGCFNILTTITVKYTVSVLVCSLCARTTIFTKKAPGQP